MTNHVDGNTKKERTKKLLKLSETLEENYYKQNIGKEEEILIEKQEEGKAYGHTTNYLYLTLKGDYKENEIYKITITQNMIENNKITV